MSKERNALEPRGIDPSDLDIGRSVVYRTAPDYEPEQGVITSFNGSGVFVRYQGKMHSQCTSRCDLDWAMTHNTPRAEGGDV